MTPGTTVAYLGPQGTFSEEAAILYAPDSERSPYPSIRDAAIAAESRETEEAVLPIENSIEGAVNMTLDYLIHDSTLSIVGEIVLPIRQCLIAAEGSKREDIVTIRSHPQALAQCRRYLETTYPNASLIASISTAGAVEEALNEGRNSAAIGNRRAAELFGATVLEADIEDNSNNMTRFVAMGRNSPSPSGNDKTSICFGFDSDTPGQLYGVLGEFAERDINMAKIESRPTRHELGRYVFLADLLGHQQDEGVRDALSAVERRVSELKVFGSYPRNL
ncbi:MAG: prephenate dehydratase [Dehalococcoidia bacterium]|nr:prephenate dehydratase [Dehalococcoidia bacterium]